MAAGREWLVVGWLLRRWMSCGRRCSVVERRLFGWSVSWASLVLLSAGWWVVWDAGFVVWVGRAHCWVLRDRALWLALWFGPSALWAAGMR